MSGPKTSGIVLGRHLCRTKLPRKVFNPKTKSETKSETNHLKKAPKRPRKNLSPVQPPENISLARFTVLNPQFQTRFQTQLQNMFHNENLKGWRRKHCSYSVNQLLARTSSVMRYMNVTLTFSRHLKFQISGHTVCHLTRKALGLVKTLRAKGTLISEPRFSTPCEMRFNPRDTGKTAFLKKVSL